MPLVVWAITSGEMRVAFLLFLAAGISDAVDGFLAKRFHMASELGAYLDPLADKALIVSIYVSLGIAGALPIFLVILVVSRHHHDHRRLHAVLARGPTDAGPSAAGLESQHRGANPARHPGALAEQGFQISMPISWSKLTMAAVAVLTLLSIAFYLAEWVRHMNSFGARSLIVAA